MSVNHRNIMARTPKAPPPKSRWTNDPAAMFWVSVVGLVISVAGVLVVAAYTYVAYWQAQLTREQIDLDERPWVSVDVQLDGPLVHDAEGWNQGVHWHVPVKYVLKNYGKTPATHATFLAVLIPYASGLGGTNLREELDHTCHLIEHMANDQIGHGHMIFPQQERSGTFSPFGELQKPQENSAHYEGAFLIDACVAYNSSVIIGKYRTAQAFYLTKKTKAPIDLKGETLDPGDLDFVPATLYGSDAR